MHNAPPVVYPVGRFFGGIGCWVVLVLMGALGLLCWQFFSHAEGVRLGGAWMLWLVSSGWALWLAPQEASDRGHLAWSDGLWHWRDENKQEWAVHLNPLVDFGQSLWVSYRATNDARWMGGRPQFACVHQASMPLSWHGFRCAVYSRPSETGQLPERHPTARKI
jgi:hypothetical protein